jgi:hypothetical protein
MCVLIINLFIIWKGFNIVLIYKINKFNKLFIISTHIKTAQLNIEHWLMSLFTICFYLRPENHSIKVQT